MQQISLLLDEVKSHFEHWRATRTKQRERIPQYLWEEVKTLLDRYSLKDITTALRINTGQIKDNLKIQTKINFAEVQMDTLNLLSNHSSHNNREQICSIELHRANGVILKISALSMVSIQKIVSQFME